VQPDDCYASGIALYAPAFFPPILIRNVSLRSKIVRLKYDGFRKGFVQLLKNLSGYASENLNVAHSFSLSLGL